MLTMINIAAEEHAIVREIGARLREARLARDENQEVFAQRLGITRQTYSKMEKGSPAVPIGYWLMASSILGRLESWANVIKEKQNLFDLYEQKKIGRARASGRPKNKS